MNGVQTINNAKEPQMAALEIGLVLAAIKPIVDGVYASGKSVLTEQFKKTTADRIVRQLSSRAKDVSEVKTLLCLERPVYLTEFYSPQYIIDTEGKRKELVSPDALGSDKRVIIVGVAGQGKSILFRYLVLHELARRNLPLFIELRNFEHQDSLVDLLLAELSALGFPEDTAVMDHLLGGGRCVLYLDAFDEVPPIKQSKARKQIEDLSRKFPELRVFVSSRPSLTIQGSPLFRVARLDSLRPEESKKALFKMCDKTDDTEKISQELKNANSRLTELLTTPLMVALLLLHFRLSGEFPETEQAFFGDLFDVLLRRHDQTKGYTRIKHSSASESELLQLFGYLSFLSRKQGLVEMPREHMVQICERGKRHFNRSYTSDGALDDIVKGTNLILEDGSSCRYAHKAIQEFYAAKFLATQADADIQTFLSNRIKSWDTWAQLLEFFELIDHYSFIKHFLIPHVSWIAYGAQGKRVIDGWRPSKKVYERVFGDDHVGIREESIRVYGPAHMSKFFLFRKKSFPRELFEAFGSIDTIALVNSIRDEFITVHDDAAIDDGAIKMLKMKGILASPFGDKVRAALEPMLLDSLNEIRNAYEFVDYRQNQGDLFE